MLKQGREILKEWLEIDLYKTAFKMGLVKAKYEVNEQLIMDTIRYIDYESVMEKEPSVNFIITIIGLMWEHIDHKNYDIKKIIIKFLSRIGYPVSAIICDQNYDWKTGSFSMMDSWIDEVYTTIHQMNNEIEVAGKRYLLTEYQKRIWDSMECDRILGISAPTSSGKSFVILLKLVERLQRENIDVVYIVPTLSLLNQVTEDFNRELKNVGVTDYWISHSFDRESDWDIKNIYVMTQEKAIAAFSDSKEAFSKKLILVADEIQNIERIENDDDQRAKILFDALIEFRYKKNVEQIIISGPRIEHIGKVGENIFGIETKSHTTEVSPVLNITYSIRKENRQFYLKQYCALVDSPIVLKIENDSMIKGYGKKHYTNEYLEYLSGMVKRIGDGAQNIIFAPTSKMARKIAGALEGGDGGEIIELVDYYASTIRENYFLCKTLKCGVAYHHGKLPLHVRRTLERAISEKKINSVVCTTTLLQGVNLPAQNIFIRNPHLYVRKNKNSVELTNYEIANLRGRAGRLLKDYIGRAFVLDETEFICTDGYESTSLFGNPTKEIPAGYEQCFEKHRDAIESILGNNETLNATMKEYGYIISYIRQSVLRYGVDSQKRMNDVGIKLTQKQVAAIILNLKGISVPQIICYKNRYWDPLVLDVIYKEFKGSLPNTPMESGAELKLNKILQFLKELEATTDMYNRYIPSKYQLESRNKRMIHLVMQWSKGTKLCDILKADWYDGDEGTEHIDDTIGLLQNTISYSLPLLLKPLYDMKNPESCFLTCMQLGAFNTMERCMIEMGIPRETALWLFKEKHIGKDLQGGNKLELERDIRKKVRENYRQFPYWIQIQLEFLV